MSARQRDRPSEIAGSRPREFSVVGQVVVPDQVNERLQRSKQNSLVARHVPSSLTPRMGECYAGRGRGATAPPSFSPPRPACRTVQRGEGGSVLEGKGGQSCTLVLLGVLHVRFRLRRLLCTPSSFGGHERGRWVCRSGVPGSGGAMAVPAGPDSRRSRAAGGFGKLGGSVSPVSARVSSRDQCKSTYKADPKCLPSAVECAAFGWAR
jgi:hypothetical protein